MPEALAKRRPGAAIEPAGNWGGFTEAFCCVRLLNPLDPLFAAIGSAFVKARRCRCIWISTLCFDFAPIMALARQAFRHEISQPLL